MQLHQSALIDAGIRFYGPDLLRRPKRGLPDMLGLKTHKNLPEPTRSAPDQIDFMFKDRHRLILSDENFIGVLHDQDGRILSPLYPRAAPRVEELATTLDLGAVDIFLGLRNPTGFLTWAYSQALLGGRKVGFAEYLQMNPLRQVFWSGLVARLRATPGVGHIYVWRQEDYRTMFHDICGALLGPSVDFRIAPYPERLHLGLSEAAIADVLSQPNGADIRRISVAAREAFPVGDTYPAFALFSASDVAKAAADYDH